MDYDVAHHRHRTDEKAEWCEAKYIVTLEACRSKESSGLQFVSRPRVDEPRIEEHELLDWLEDTTNNRETALRVVFMFDRYASQTIPMTEPTWRKIERSLGLPAEVSTIAWTPMPTFLDFVSKSETSILGHGMVIRHFNRTIICVHSRATACTTVLCFGYSSNITKKIKPLIWASGSPTNWFLHILILLVEEETRHLARFSGNRNDMLLDMQHVLNFTDLYLDPSRVKRLGATASEEQEDKTLLSIIRKARDYIFPSKRTKTKPSKKTSKYDRILSYLVSITQSVPNILCGCEFQLRLLLHFESILTSATVESQALACPSGERANYLNWVRYLIQIQTSARDQTKSAFEKNQALLSVVSTLSKQREAAQAARDSTDMRIIAIVTLIFLPATFAATFFSTSFFNFDETSESRTVSPWIWLYWAITVGLTLIVLGCWYVVSRSGRARPRSFDQLMA